MDQKTSESGNTKKNEMGWEDAIHKILSEADGALHYTEIADRIASSGLRRDVGPTPAATVAAKLSTLLREENSEYLRTDRGVYTLKRSAETKNAELVAEAVLDAAEEEHTGALRAFGMFWQRSSVIWTPKDGKLYGKQGTGASDVNFADQIGVYLLHDRERVIYVGRAADTLYGRLRAHTSDRLGGRWDRFSWFGIRNVLGDGKLSDSKVPWNQNVVIETMEALLIESLEPPLNRRRGDGFSAAEYIQVLDPQIKRLQQQQMLDELAKKVAS